MARAARRSAGLRGHGVLEALGLQIQGLDKDTQKADRAVGADVVVEGFGKQSELLSVHACHMSHRLSPAEISERCDLL